VKDIKFEDSKYFIKCTAPVNMKQIFIPTNGLAYAFGKA
jgi:hypothetical protein